MSFARGRPEEKWRFSNLNVEFALMVLSFLGSHGTDLEKVIQKLAVVILAQAVFVFGSKQRRSADPVMRCALVAVVLATGEDPLWGEGPLATIPTYMIAPQTLFEKRSPSSGIAV